MTNVFNDQIQNTVFASPDGANGQPVFRSLTANDIPTIVSIEPFILPNVLSVPCNIGGAYYFTSNANTFVELGGVDIPNTIGNVLLQIIVSGDTTQCNVGNVSAGYFIGAPSLQYQLRIGPNGNSSDTIVLIAPCNVALVTWDYPYGGVPNLPTNFNQVIFATLSSNGANSQLAVSSMVDVLGGNIYSSNVSTSTIDLTSNLYLTISAEMGMWSGVYGITGQIISRSNVNFNIVTINEI